MLVIVVDTLRADHVYGNRIRTPNMDALVRQGLRFTRAYPEAMPTVPARNSILSGVTYGLAAGNDYGANACKGVY